MNFQRNGRKFLQYFLLHVWSKCWLSELIKPFYEPDSHSKIIAGNSCVLIAPVYDYTNVTLSLDDLRSAINSINWKVDISIRKILPSTLETTT